MDIDKQRIAAVRAPMRSKRTRPSADRSGRTRPFRAGRGRSTPALAKLGLLLANAYVVLHVAGLAWALWLWARSLAAS